LIATRFVAAVEAAFEPLRRLPLSGAPREQFAPGLRVIFHGAYAIYYTPRPEALVIVRVLHGARDITTLSERGGFM
jgi:toxin ParE1/3/4